MQWMSEELATTNISLEKLADSIRKSATQNGLKLETKQIDTISTYTLSALEKANFSKLNTGVTQPKSIPFQKSPKKTLMIKSSHKNLQNSHVLMEHMVQEDESHNINSSSWKARYATWKKNVRLFRSGWVILSSWLLLNLALFFIGFFCKFRSN